MPALAHLGIGFAAKRINSKIHILILLISALLLDLLSIIFTKSLWPTHGMVMAIVWALIASLLTIIYSHFMNSKKGTDYQTIKNGLIIGILVFSHWILDFIGWPMSAVEGIMDVPDSGTPFFLSDTPNYGLGIYSTWAGAIIMEIGVLIIGLGLFINYRNNKG
ncbi:MAG: hypothetical protein INQ03_14740 [Candidatus Heimdallarchaeota archaeon]|nr:hypothetical protein [Candidatus Heimdallarchaeota archaeon]